MEGVAAIYKGLKGFCSGQRLAQDHVSQPAALALDWETNLMAIQTHFKRTSILDTTYERR